MSLRNLGNLSSLLQCAVGFNSLIHIDRSQHDVTYRTLHLVAKILSLCEVLSLDGVLNFSSELSEVHLTRSTLDSEETLEAEADNGEQQSQNQTYHETTLINGTQKVCRMT